MNRILATPLFSDDHSGRTADIINAEETGRGEDRVQRPRRNDPIPVRYSNRIRSILWTDDTLKSEPHAYADTLGGGGKIYAEDTNGGRIGCASAHGGLCGINMLCFVCSVKIKKSASATPAKTAEFMYRCFKCGEEDNPKSYTWARDLMIHCVNRYQVYPQGAKHNQEYAADGTDLRPARLDKIEQYASLASHKAQLKTVVPPGPKKAGKKRFTARIVKSVIIKAPKASVTEASTLEEAVGSEEDPEACRTKETVPQGYKIPKKPFRNDKEVDAEPSMDQKLIEMNGIATARAARDSAAKDAHITKKMLVEAAIEKVKEQIIPHRASKMSTEASASDTKVSVSADKDKLYARDTRSGASQSQSSGYIKEGGVHGGTEEDVTGGGRGRIY